MPCETIGVGNEEGHGRPGTVCPSASPVLQRWESLETIREASFPPISFDRRASSDSIGRIDAITDIEKSQGNLPQRRGTSWTRALCLNDAKTYRALFAVVSLANITAMIVVLSQWGKSDPWVFNNILATAVSANVTLATIFRNELFVNMLFLLAAAVPQSAPLWVRTRACQVYHYGGVHSSAAMAATGWYIVLTSSVAYLTHVNQTAHNWVLTSLSASIACILVMMCVSAMPLVRSCMHNGFERIHRFGGWTVVALLSIQLILTVGRPDQTGPSDILQNPAIWLLLVTAACILWPWMNTRRVSVTVEQLSPHAIRVHFQGAVRSCMGIRVAVNPLDQLHAFATIPGTSTGCANDDPSFSIIISNAGDWTHRIIATPPSHFWIRGLPTFGVIRLAPMFSPVVVVATGSGIGPCLGLFVGAPTLKCRVLWVTKNPERTYGIDIVLAVMRADPRAIIVDTDVSGRPDLVSATYHLYVESAAEAVFCISNRTTTRDVVRGMEARGVPAYGPIWDS